MASYNNGFPMNYPQYYPQYPQYNYSQQPLMQQAAQQQQQAMTPPMIHAEILQVENEQAAENYPVAAGASQMMIRKDDNEIYIKTAFANGQSRLDVYAKQPERKSSMAANLDGYVTKEEFEARINAIVEEIKKNGIVQSVRDAATARAAIAANESNASDPAA